MILQAVSSEQLAELYHIRREVFVVEQGVPESLEYDEFEDVCNHYGFWLDGHAVACARWRLTKQGYAKIERCAVLIPYRGKKIGAAIVQHVINEIPEQNIIYLHAQSNALGFYSRLGFEAVGSEFYEAKIPHFKMIFTHR